METTYGPVCVAVCGDPDKPALITYPDIALNCKRTYILTSSSLLIEAFESLGHVL